MKLKGVVAIGQVFLLGFFLVEGCSKSAVPPDLHLTVEPDSITFPSVKKGSTESREVRLRHGGTGGIVRISKIYLEKGSSPEFSLQLPEGKWELEPGGNPLVVTVVYSPQDSIADAGALVIEHNVPSQGYKTVVPISATAQIASLTCDPNPLDFGQVRSGSKSEPKDLMLRNDGSDAITIVKAPYFRIDSSQDFHQVGDPVFQNGAAGFPITLEPDQWVGLVFEYEPTGGGEDTGYLVVDTEQAGVKSYVTCTMHGQEVGPKVVAFPGTIDFGAVALNETRSVQVTVENHGFSVAPEDSLLTIPQGGITFGPGSNEDLFLRLEGGEPEKTLPPKEWQIKADDFESYPQMANVPKSVTFEVLFRPTKAIPDTGEPLGWLWIASNDPIYNPLQIEIRGKVAAPVIAVFPDPVDFSAVGQMITAERTLTILNTGNGDLEFTEPLKIVGDPNGEFGVKEDPNFKPTLPTYNASADCPGTGGQKPESCVIHPGESRAVTLLFTNKGPATGSASATLVIHSNSPGLETVEVKLVATRAGVPTCDPVIAPAKLDYGVVPKGYYKEMMFKLINNGTGYCSFHSARVEDCTGMMGMAVQCPEPGKGTPSTVFTIMGLPPAIQNGLGPKGSLDFKIRFTPPVNESIFGQLMSYVALFSATVHDPQLKQLKTVPVCSTGLGGITSCQPNLEGRSGVAKISVMPAEIDFGVVTIGCFSKPEKVCIYNTGNAPLTVSGISPKGCTPEFKLKNVPALPKALNPGVPMCFETAYAPQDPGTDMCVLEINSTDSSAPLVTVRLKGVGTYDTEQTDEFTQVSGQEVDVLFVIDDSGSMCGEQDQLAAAYDYFIKNAKVWNNDYHLGVISPNVVDDKVVGMLNYGDPKKMPRYLTPVSGTKEKFAEFAKLGCNGGPHCGGFSGPCTDEQESGLQAAQIALSAPLTTDTGVPCNSDSDCKNNPSVCVDPAACPYYCLAGDDGKKTCGGWNKGFLREDAQLEIVILSDEEDQSPGPVSTYIDFFKNIKGFYNVTMMHVHSIVGADPPTCSESEAGKRYIEVSKQTNGVIGDICDPSYAQTMSKIGDITFGLKVQFFLSRLADPMTIEVWVNGKSCTSGWVYDEKSNSIVFQGNENDTDPCRMPKPGDKIKVHYKTLCLKG